MYYNKKMVPHIGSRPVSPGFVAGSVVPTAPIVQAAPALVTSMVQPTYVQQQAYVAPPVMAATQVITEACPVGNPSCYYRWFSI